jgi:hypothetical protein
MKHATLPLSLLAFSFQLFLLGCAAKPQPRYVAPSVVAVKTGIEKLRPHVTPAGVPALSALEQAVTTYEQAVADQSTALHQAHNDVTYWQVKQVKALKELWMWRGLAALTLASVAGWLAIRMGFRLAL